MSDVIVTCDNWTPIVPKAIAEAISGDPKALVGNKKPGITAIPPSALIHLGRAMADGQRKYGLMNWRKDPVTASVYMNGMFRHWGLYWDGENYATDSLVHHLAHLMAGCAIMLDAEAHGTLIDDRPKPGPLPSVLAYYTKE